MTICSANQNIVITTPKFSLLHTGVFFTYWPDVARPMGTFD